MQSFNGKMTQDVLNKLTLRLSKLKMEEFALDKDNGKEIRKIEDYLAGNSIEETLDND